MADLRRNVQPLRPASGTRIRPVAAGITAITLSQQNGFYAQLYITAPCRLDIRSLLWLEASNAECLVLSLLNSDKYDLQRLPEILTDPRVKVMGALQDPVKQARTTQEQTTKLLAELLQAPDTAATARKHVDSINEEFFMVSSTYLDMVCVICFQLLQMGILLPQYPRYECDEHLFPGHLAVTMLACITELHVNK